MGLAKYLVEKTKILGYQIGRGLNEIFLTFDTDFEGAVRVDFRRQTEESNSQLCRSIADCYAKLGDERQNRIYALFARKHRRRALRH